MRDYNCDCDPRIDSCCLPPAREVPPGGKVGQVLTRTERGYAWRDGGAVVGESFVTDVALGHLPAGTQINADDKVSDILMKILKSDQPGPVPPTPTGTIDVYTGSFDTIPTSIDDFSKMTSVDKSELISDKGFVVKVNTDNQFACLAISEDAGIDCYDIQVGGFSMGFINDAIDGYYMYRFQSPTTESNVRYTYLFEEE